MNANETATNEQLKNLLDAARHAVEAGEDYCLPEAEKVEAVRRLRKALDQFQSSRS